MRFRGTLAVTAAGVLLAALGACSRLDRGDDDPGAGSAPDRGPAKELRLGYFPNVTHAAALIGLEQGQFARELASAGSTTLVPTRFNDGTTEVGALLGGSLDAGFIGSGPAINAYAKSDGAAVRLIAGATVGGAQLVTAPEITTPADLIGRTVVTPALGNTQDVALKKWLNDKGLAGRVQVTNLENALTLDAFRSGEVQAAWLPEPWSSRLVLEAGAKVLVDEKELWPHGRFPTTVLVVRAQYLRDHPQTVRALLRGLLAAVDAAGDRTGAQAAVNRQLKVLTGKELSGQVIERAWTNIELTLDPVAAQFPRLAMDQVGAGVVERAPDVTGFADFSALNTVLSEAGRTELDPSGLDKK